MTPDELAAECRRINALAVDVVTVRIAQYAAVALTNAERLLGEKDFARMMKNPVRNKGPREGFIYPWNVVDYLSGYRTEAEKRSGK
jgi:hypothetical protein